MERNKLLQLRLAHQEAALLTLHQQIADLRASLQFETEQRMAYEAMVGQLTDLPRRVAELERARGAGE